MNLMGFYGLNKIADLLVPIGKIAHGGQYYDQLLSLRHKNLCKIPAFVVVL